MWFCLDFYVALCFYLGFYVALCVFIWIFMLHYVVLFVFMLHYVGLFEFLCCILNNCRILVDVREIWYYPGLCRVEQGISV